LGNVILLPQPERGEKQDDKLLHTRDTPPPHNYLAFYWWLEEEFKADAIMHWGTHGSLELLPGKEAGLTRDSWSDICVGDLPVVNLWITDNIAEATLSRRRSYAALVDHLPPPALNAGLSEGLRNLHDDTSKFRALEAGLLKEQYRKRISTAAREEKIDEILKLPHGGAAYGDAAIGRIAEYVQHLAEEQTPLTLHVLGESMARKDQPAYLVSILGKKFLDHLSAVAPSDGVTASEADRRAALREQGARLLDAVLFDEAPAPVELTADLRKDLDFGREIKRRLNDTGQEIEGLVKALDGRYLAPGPGPDPIRNPESAPGGRNLYSLNPEEIPTRPAWDVAVQLVDELLRMRKPKKVGMDLNGMDTMRDFGVMEAQALYLMGVRPIWDRNSLAIDVELIPRAELKRARVDVFIAMGGQYKENFPTRVELLDKAVRLASAADEPDNYVRERTQENARQLQQRGMPAEQAAQLAPARIFGTKQGNMSGTNILYLIPRSGVWDKDAEVADVYVDNMSWVYTKGAWGQKIDGLYQQAIQGTDTLVRNWSSNMTSQLSNHHAYEYLGGLSMAVKSLTGREAEAFIADVRSADGARMREFGEVLSTTFKTELLNPNWIKGMKEHGYAGAGHAAELVKNTFGWSVTRTGSVSDSTWNEIYSVYVEDKLNLGVREWMEKENPHALQEMAATMMEASRKGYWKADEKTLQSLARVYRDSVAAHGESNGLVSGGNKALEQFIGHHLDAPGSVPTSAAPGPASAAAASAPAPPPLASAASRAATVVGQVMAPVKQALRAPRPAAAARAIGTLASVLMSTASLALLLTGFVRREGAL
jgi:cobaltochelatase CobN